MPEYNPLDRYIIDAAERKMKEANKPPHFEPPHTEIFFKDTIKDVQDRMAVRIQQIEDQRILSDIKRWMDEQPWYRRLWWRIRRFFYPLWLEMKIDRERQKLEDEDE